MNGTDGGADGRRRWSHRGRRKASHRGEAGRANFAAGRAQESGPERHMDVTQFKRRIARIAPRCIPRCKVALEPRPRLSTFIDTP